MGSIIRLIDDMIEEYGSLDAYIKNLESKIRNAEAHEDPIAARSETNLHSNECDCHDDLAV